MTNKHRVGVIAFLVLVAGCGSKETAEPQREAKIEAKVDAKVDTKVDAKPTSKQAPELGHGDGNAADCARAKAELDRLQACKDDLDEELVENMKQLEMALTDPNVPPDVKQLIMDGCKHTIGLTADMNCSNIKKKSHRRRSASADE